jgi:hypothetical protein
VPKSTAINSGFGAATLIACIAAMPPSAGSCRSAGMTNVEKAKNTPPAMPAPMALMVDREGSARWIMAITQPACVETIHRSSPQLHAPSSNQLEKEVRELRMKTEFLGKAAAFFAQEYR